MAKSQANKYQIKSFEQANNALIEIAALEAEIEKSDAIRKQALTEVQSAYDEATKDIVSDLEMFRTNLEEFCNANKEEIGKSKELTNGVLGFRAKPESVVYDGDEKEIAEQIKKKDSILFDRVCETKYALSKTFIKTYCKQFNEARKQLSKFGIRIISGESSWFYKTKPVGA